jgi:hypothetical protein
MPTVPNYEALKDKQAELIRKATDGSAFLAASTVAAIAALTEYVAPVVGPPAEPAKRLLSTLPTGYVDLGWLTTDGAQFAREVATSNITSWGSVSPTRSDVTSDTSTLTVVAQETKLITIGMATGADLEGIVGLADTGEVIVKKPARANSRSYRCLVLAVDENSFGEIYMGRYLPRAKVTGYSNQNFGGGDNAVEWGITLTGEEDSTLGYSEAWFFGGDGWYGLLDAMGIEEAA